MHKHTLKLALPIFAYFRPALRPGTAFHPLWRTFQFHLLPSCGWLTLVAELWACGKWNETAKVNEAANLLSREGFPSGQTEPQPWFLLACSEFLLVLSAFPSFLGGPSLFLNCFEFFLVLSLVNYLLITC